MKRKEIEHLGTTNLEKSVGEVNCTYHQCLLRKSSPYEEVIHPVTLRNESLALCRLLLPSNCASAGKASTDHYIERKSPDTHQHTHLC